MRLRWSALFFSLGLVIGTVLSDAGASRRAVADVPAPTRIIASDTAKTAATPETAPLVTPSASPELHRDLPTAQCERDAASCSTTAVQTARS
jgi:hypothetical protein